MSILFVRKEAGSRSLNLKADDLAYYNSDKKEWIIEPIEYIVYIGPSSKKEDLLSASFRVI